MTRIGTYGANQLYVARLKEIQARVSQEQIQVSTEKKSLAYGGIATDSNRLINFETEKTRAQQYITNNEQANTKLQAALVATSAIEDTMKAFRKKIDDFYSSTTRTKQDIEGLQNWAWRSMLDMQSYLSANVGGEYLFGGGRITTEPVQLPTDTLSGFQAIYDGNDVTYPTTRSAQMFELHTKNDDTGDISFDASTGTITAADLTSATNNPLADIPVGSRITVSDSANGANDGKSFTVRSVTVDATNGTSIQVSRLTSEGPTTCTVGWDDGSGGTTTLAADLTFYPGSDTIDVSNATSFAAGQVFTVSGSGSNDGTYEVESINAGPPDTITIKSTKVSNAAAASTITLDADNWYKGDTMVIEHRIDSDRAVATSVYASDPAFEKAFRAMALIAQGVYGTAGGLENNIQRVEQARFLIHDAIDNPAGANPPFGAEETGDIQVVQANIGIVTNIINAKNDKHQAYIGFLEERIAKMENVDPTEAVSKLVDDQNALQAAYQALAKTREFNLLDFMK